VHPVSLSDVRAARERIDGHVHRTPLLRASRLGDRVGVSLYHKCESLQKTGSFKSRGALNAVLQLDAAARERGVVTVSAGNHAQALAWAAASAGVRSTVVMPARAVRTKVEASRGYGAEVVLHGANSIESFAHATDLARERGLTFIHPFDHPHVIAGAGTTGLEIVEQCPDLTHLVVAIGGGGLISGIAVAVRALKPDVRIIGVEPRGSAVLRKSLDAGKPMRLESIDTVADGLTAPMAGEVTFPIIRDLVDDVVVIEDAPIVEAMHEIARSAKLVVEPAGGAATAAVLSGAIAFPRGATVVAVLSGGNAAWLDQLGA
jgi:threonine dehydratase